MNHWIDQDSVSGLEIEVIPDRGRVIVAPRGEIDLVTVARVRERLGELEDAGFHSIVLDLQNVTFIDSTGVHLVLTEVKRDGIDFAVIRGPTQVQRIFELSGLLESVPFLSPASPAAPRGSALTSGPTNDSMNSSPDLQVIAIVASAGGLAAASEVLRTLPAELQAAVIVLIHQAPDRENALVHLLGRESRLPVQAARDGMRLRAGTAVVAPPGRHTLIAAGPTLALIISGAAPPNRPSADLLLTTLALACGARATAVILSGGGHDGATGATAIHHFGGTVMASTNMTSQHSSMPQATIERDHVIDHIVPLSEIGAILGTITADRAV